LGIDSERRFRFFKKIKGISVKQLFKEKQISYIIDNRPRNNLLRELITIGFTEGEKKIMMVHSFKLENYFQSLHFGLIFVSKAVKIVCVSNAIEKEVKLKFDLQNIKTIYNPFDFSRTKSVKILRLM
jgi:hypothetical protein